MKNYFCSAIFIILILSQVACKKYLEEKPNQKLVIPSSVADVQALLDNSNYVNNYSNYFIGESSSDNTYLSDQDWATLQDGERNIYTWGDELFYNAYPNGWSDLYYAVNQVNTVLFFLEKIEKTANNATDWNNAMGSALFFRSVMFHQAVICWGNAYDEQTSQKDFGIPLKLTPDFEEKSVRANVKDCYEKIVGDLKKSIPLLPIVPKHVTRPSRPAAYGMLARVYLSVRDYPAAKLYADSCLQLKGSLMDYNSLNPDEDYPIPLFNSEVIFDRGGGSAITTYTKVQKDFYDSYNQNDLRRKIFFKFNEDNTISFKGNYDNYNGFFNGVATDEVYLTRAECSARAGNTSDALKDLNLLIKNRWDNKIEYPEILAVNAQDALAKILVERRKELFLRDLRWMDLKRLNKDPAHQITISRVVNGVNYSLKPNSPKYALPIPQVVIERSGMPQNPH